MSYTKVHTTLLNPKNITKSFEILRRDRRLTTIMKSMFCNDTNNDDNDDDDDDMNL